MDIGKQVLPERMGPEALDFKLVCPYCCSTTIIMFILFFWSRIMLFIHFFLVECCSYLNEGEMPSIFLAGGFSFFWAWGEGECWTAFFFGQHGIVFKGQGPKHLNVTRWDIAQISLSSHL